MGAKSTAERELTSRDDHNIFVKIFYRIFDKEHKTIIFKSQKIKTPVNYIIYVYVYIFLIHVSVYVCVCVCNAFLYICI